MVSTFWAQAFNYVVWGGLSFVWVCYAVSLVLKSLGKFSPNAFLFITIGFVLLILIIALPVLLLPKKFIAAVGELPYKCIRHINEQREAQNRELWIALGLDSEE